MNLTAGYNADIARAYGINEALLLDAIAFWARHSRRKDGYCWFTAEEFELRTAIKSSTMRRAIAKLVALGIIDVKNTYIIGTQIKCRHFKIVGRVESGYMEIKQDLNVQNDKSGPSKLDKSGPSKLEQSVNSSKQNSKQNNTTNNDTLLKELLNKVTGRNFRVLPNGYKKTLKEFTLEEIEKALLTMKKDKWHSERWGSLKSDYLIRSSTIDNFLNKKSSGYNQSVSAEDLYGDGSWMK